MVKNSDFFWEAEWGGETEWKQIVSEKRETKAAFSFCFCVDSRIVKTELQVIFLS